MLRARRLTAPAVVVLAALACVSPSPASAASTATYVASGTVVARDDSNTVSLGDPTLADQGGLICSPTAGVGVGGGCVDFGPYDSIRVDDLVHGTNVAFQVCIDNNGDNFCTSPDRNPVCPDQIFFSHGAFIPGSGFDNALGPLPVSFLPGCPGGRFRGYVVFLCTGVHNGVEGTAQRDAHVHPAVAGTISGTVGGTGVSSGGSRGTFCGGTDFVPSNKAYVALP